MQFLGRFCLLVVVCSAIELHQRILQLFLGLLLMDFASFLKFLARTSELKGGFLVLGCFSPVFNVLGLFFMFGLGLRLLQFGWQGKGLIHFLCEISGKSGDKKCGFCSKKGFDCLSGSKIMSFWCNSMKFLNNSKARNKDSLYSDSFDYDENDYGKECDNDDDDDYGRKICVEDEEFDVMALRRLVKIERQRAEMAYVELEKERMASASAADEAMAMILRLQREKSSIEIESNQHHRLAKQKEEYDSEVIESLQWIIMKHESERTVLEEKLRLCKEKLKQYIMSDELDQFFEGYESDSSFHVDADSAMEDGSEDAQTNSGEKTSRFCKF